MAILKNVMLFIIAILCIVQLAIIVSSRFGETELDNQQLSALNGMVQNQTLAQLSLELKQASESVIRSAEKLAHLRAQGPTATAPVSPKQIPTVLPPLAKRVKVDGDTGSAAAVGRTHVTVSPAMPNVTVRNERPKNLPPAAPVDFTLSPKPKRAAIFTMDSFPGYEDASKRGGAAGELLIRFSLQHAFDKLSELSWSLHMDALRSVLIIYVLRLFICVDVKYSVIQSDAQFASLKADEFDFIILDPWTWAGKGWIAKPTIRGQDAKIFMLDFFGFHKLPNLSLRVPDNRFLTAYGGSASNSFLGYFLPPPLQGQGRPVRKNQGVIWGKDVKHYEGAQKVRMLRAVAAVAPLVSTAMRAVFTEPNIVWAGHQTREQWSKLLSESKFVIGLGDPLLGPSAIDAVSHGCVYINPLYDAPVRGGHFASQHPYAMEKIGPPRVCSARIADVTGMLRCVEGALAQDLEPVVLEDFTEEAYLQRVRSIFML